MLKYKVVKSKNRVNRRSHSYMSVVLAFKVLAFIINSGRAKDRIVRHVKGLFYLIGDGQFDRSWTSYGYYKFSQEFGKYHVDLRNVSTDEELNDFYDRLYILLDECFPLSETEEIYI